MGEEAPWLRVTSMVPVTSYSPNILRSVYQFHQVILRHNHK